MEEYRPFEYDEVINWAWGRAVELKKSESKMKSAHQINGVSSYKGDVFVAMGGRRDVVEAKELLQLYQFVDTKKPCGMKG
jgi:hypothetical protein